MLTSPNTIYGYDFANRLTSVTQTLLGAPGNQVLTSYGYDIQDNLNSVTDPNTNGTTYLFDDFRRMRRQTSPVTGVTNYTHDPASNLLTLADANAATTTRTYDALNRALTAQSVRSGFPTENVTFTYDSATSGNFGKGRLASMTDPTGSSTYAYERRGMLRQENRTVQGNAYALSYAYDNNGNRRQVTYPSSLVVNYTFDFADRQLSATPAVGTAYVTSAKYRPFGPLEQIRYGNGTTKTMDYDNRYRPTLNKLEKDSPLTTLAHYSLTPDFVGNLTQITDVQNAGYNRTYGYDDLHRLTTTNSGASLWGNGSHAYDAMGNLASLTLGVARTATFAYLGTTPKLSSVTESGGIGTRNVTLRRGGQRDGGRPGRLHLLLPELSGHGRGLHLRLRRQRPALHRHQRHFPAVLVLQPGDEPALGDVPHDGHAAADPARVHLVRRAAGGADRRRDAGRDDLGLHGPPGHALHPDRLGRQRRMASGV